MASIQIAPAVNVEVLDVDGQASQMTATHIIDEIYCIANAGGAELHNRSAHREFCQGLSMFRLDGAAPYSVLAQTNTVRLRPSQLDSAHIVSSLRHVDVPANVEVVLPAQESESAPTALAAIAWSIEDGVMTLLIESKLLDARVCRSIVGAAVTFRNRLLAIITSVDSANGSATACAVCHLRWCPRCCEPEPPKLNDVRVTENVLRVDGAIMFDAWHPQFAEPQVLTLVFAADDDDDVAVKCEWMDVRIGNGSKTVPPPVGVQCDHLSAALRSLLPLTTRRKHLVGAQLQQRFEYTLQSYLATLTAANRADIVNRMVADLTDAFKYLKDNDVRVVVSEGNVAVEADAEGYKRTALIHLKYDDCREDCNYDLELRELLHVVTKDLDPKEPPLRPNRSELQPPSDRHRKGRRNASRRAELCLLVFCLVCVPVTMYSAVRWSTGLLKMLPRDFAVTQWLSQITRTAIPPVTSRTPAAARRVVKPQVKGLTEQFTLASADVDDDYAAADGYDDGHDVQSIEISESASFKPTEVGQKGSDGELVQLDSIVRTLTHETEALKTLLAQAQHELQSLRSSSNVESRAFLAPKLQQLSECLNVL